MSKTLDEIDLRILSEIQADGRITNVELAKRVGISPPPCLRRVRTLEEEGYIQGYRGLLDPRLLGFDVTVFASVHLSSQADADLRAFEEFVRDAPLVRECWMLSGDVDFILGDCYGGACADAVTAHVEAFLLRSGVTVRRNNPYSGGYVTQTYGRPAEGVHVLQLEISRRLYMDEATLAPNAGFAVTRDLLGSLIVSLRDLAADLMKRR